MFFLLTTALDRKMPHLVELVSALEREIREFLDPHVQPVGDVLHDAPGAGRAD
jgi:hypothetical protein